MSAQDELAIVCGGAHPALGEAIATHLHVAPVEQAFERFPDGEMHVQVAESLRGRDVFVVQPTSPSFESHVVELLLLADACRRRDARRLTAVIPYFGYARQDRRALGREALGARVAADVVQCGGFARIVCVDLHAPALEGFFAVPVDHLTAVPALARALRSELCDHGVVVAPDLGAARLAEAYAAELRLPVAIVHKVRLGGARVAVRRISGDVRGRRPILVDDMITTGGTIEASARALLEAGCRPDMVVAATHGVFVGDVAARLDPLPIRRLVTTDTIARPAASPRGVERVSVAGLLAESIARLHGTGAPARAAHA